jgi:hypothetical protein
MTDAAARKRSLTASRVRLRAAVRAAAAIVGAFYLFVGLWIFIHPHSFFDALAVFRPYSRHFLHDAGAFQAGLGLTVLLALVWSDALLVVLTGISAASWLHVASHVMDRNIGGRPATDIAGLVALAIVATVGALARLAMLRRPSDPGPGPVQ